MFQARKITTDRELKVFFFFNVMTGQDNELKLINLSSYSYKALNNQTKMIWIYAAKKGIRTRNQLSVNTTLQKTATLKIAERPAHPITISDDDNNDDNDDSDKNDDNGEFYKKPTTMQNLNTGREKNGKNCSQP